MAVDITPASHVVQITSAEKPVMSVIPITNVAETRYAVVATVCQRAVYPEVLLPALWSA